MPRRSANGRGATGSWPTTSRRARALSAARATASSCSGATARARRGPRWRRASSPAGWWPASPPPWAGTGPRMADVPVPIERLPHARDLPRPAYATPGAAGLDLLAALPAESPLRLEPGAAALVPAGIRLALPPGVEAQVRPRSGLALKHRVTVLNAPGTIDA